MYCIYVCIDVHYLHGVSSRIFFTYADTILKQCVHIIYSGVCGLKITIALGNGALFL